MDAFNDQLSHGSRDPSHLLTAHQCRNREFTPLGAAPVERVTEVYGFGTHDGGGAVALTATCMAVLQSGHAVAERLVVEAFVHADHDATQTGHGYGA